MTESSRVCTTVVWWLLTSSVRSSSTSSFPLNTCTVDDTPPGMSRVVLPEILGTILSARQADIQTFVQSRLPASFGNCAKATAPSPCLDGGGNLYAKKTSSYRVTAHWIGILNQVELSTLNYCVYTEPRVMMYVQFGFTFPNLPLSLKVEGCMGKLGCFKVFENDSSCCGQNKQLIVTFEVECHEAGAFLRHPKITQVDIRPKIQLTIDIWGKAFPIKDITSSMESSLEKVLMQSLGQQEKTLDAWMARANAQLRQVVGHEIYCTPRNTSDQLSRLAPPPSSDARPCVYPDVWLSIVVLSGIIVLPWQWMY